jgi:hypothetical protein
MGPGMYGYKGFALNPNTALRSKDENLLTGSVRHFDSKTPYSLHNHAIIEHRPSRKPLRSHKSPLRPSS